MRGLLLALIAFLALAATAESEIPDDHLPVRPGPGPIRPNVAGRLASSICSRSCKAFGSAGSNRSASSTSFIALPYSFDFHPAEGSVRPCLGVIRFQPNGFVHVGDRLLPLAPLGPHIADESLAISRTGRWLALRDWEGPVRLWDLAGKEALDVRDWRPGDCMGLTFSPNERLLAGACQFGRVRLWDVGSGEPLPDLWPYESANIWSQRVAFSPNGNRLAAGDHVGVVRVFEIPSRRLISTLKGHLGQIFSLQWFPDGKTLAVAGIGPIRLWDVDIGQECLSVTVPATQLRQSIDGRLRRLDRAQLIHQQ